MSANSTRLQITGPAPSWGVDAREGELTRSDGKTLAVHVRLLRDQPAQTKALTTLQHQARTLARCRNDHLLRLINVSAVGGNAALVYVRFDGISLAQVLNAQRMRGGWLPVKVCLEMAAQAAQGISTLCETVARSNPDHRVLANGPGIEDILINSEGELRLARVLVSGPGDPPQAHLNPGYTPPEGPDSLQANVYGLGALTLALLSTQPPPLAHPDIRHHDRQLQQAVANLGQRPGEAVPRAATQLLRLAMSGNHLVRPSTLAMATQLTEIAASMRGPGVAAWAGASVHRLRDAALRAPLGVMPDLPPPQRQAAAPLAPPPGLPGLDAPPPPARPPGLAGLEAGPPPSRRPLPTVAPAMSPRHVNLKESVDDDPTVRQDGLEPLSALGLEPEATQESQLPAGFFDQPPPEASRGGVGMGLFRSADAPVELDPDLDPALEATMMVGDVGHAEEPTVALTHTEGLQEVTEDPDAKTEAISPELREALRAPTGPAPAPPPQMGAFEPDLGPKLGGIGASGPSLGGLAEPRLGDTAARPGLGGAAAGPGLGGAAAAGGLGRMEPGLGEGGLLEPDEDDDIKPRGGGRGLLLAVIILLGLMAGVGGVMVLGGGGAGADETPADVDEAPEVLPDAPDEEPGDQEPDAEEPEAPEAQGSEGAEPPAEPVESAPKQSKPEQVTPKVTTPTPPPPKEAPKEPVEEEPEEVVPRIRVTPVATEPPKEQPAEPVAEPVTEPAPKPEPSGATPATFSVIFSSGDPSVTGLTVKCHRGDPNGHTPPVVVNDAAPGPCRVTGQGETGGLVAFVEVTGPATFTCFANGERSCK